MSLFRENINRMSAYVPGEQPPAGAKVIKLNTNENPYPPSPRALEAMRAVEPDSLRRYPHPYAQQFRLAAGRVLGVPAEWIIPGNGSDDLLAMIVLAAAERGRKVVYPMPTYVLYRTLGEMQDAACVEVPYDNEYNLPVERLIEEQGAVTFVASPNSPSGTIAPWEQLEALAADLRGLLVIDEAYTDFADENALDLVRRHPNVIILRTLSKGYSLAGLRLGFGVMQPSAAEGIVKVKDSYPVDAVATAIGSAAMEDQAYKQLCVAKVKLSRGRLTDAVRKLGFQVWPSQSNFLLAQVPGSANRDGIGLPSQAPFTGKSPLSGAEVYEALKTRGILVRYFNQPRLDDKLRITVGTDEQNAALIAALGEIVGRAT